MRKKITSSAAISYMFIAMTVTFCLTMILSARMFEAKVSSVNEKESMYGANVFKAKSNEEIVAASFYATAPDTEYKIYVVKDFKNEESFADKVLMAEGVVEDAGYYTIDLDTSVSVDKGEKYAIVLHVFTPGATHPLAIEYDSGDKFLENIDLDDGEGYISFAGNQFINVKEKQDCNICIKAFTNNR